MKRIVFLLEKMPARIRANLFKFRSLMNGINVEYIKITGNGDFPGPLETTLIVTDSVMAYEHYRASGTKVLVYLHDESEIDRFPGAGYFVIDAEDTEISYYDRVYRRIHDLPWEMYRTERLIVRETVESDVDTFAEMYKDPRMTLYMEPLYQDIEAEKKYAREYRDRVYACQGFGIWTLVRKSDNKIIGRAGLTVRSGFDGVEAGFAIGTDYWNQGYATEAVKSLLKFAASEKLGGVNAFVMPGNSASAHVLEKCGFAYEQNTVIGSTEYELWHCAG